MRLVVIAACGVLFGLCLLGLIDVASEVYLAVVRKRSK